tara:strand:- start:400 stop:771 length:372 start_codon:yes stop_codon:yes gene_type:complete
MATIDLTFDKRNSSLKIGDHVNRIDTTESGGFTTSTGAESSIGTVQSINFTDANGAAINGMRVTVDCEDSYTHNAGDFIYFAKNQQVEKSSLAGYYAVVRFQNDDISAAELYSVNSEITVSSK